MKSLLGPSPFARSLRLAAALACVLMALFYVYVQAEKQIDRAHEQRFQSLLLADELRQSSDDLTRMVRSYVVTGNQAYKQHYRDILAIRDGTKPRPLDYGDIYWDLVLLDGEPPRPDSGVAVALLTMMEQAGFTAPEFNTLQQAKANSDRLVAIELEAMALRESAGGLQEVSRQQATQMLHDRVYDQAKAAIMQPIHEFYALMGQRTLQSVRDAERLATGLRLAFVVVGLGLLLSLWRSYQALQAMLGGSVDAVHARIARIGQGEFTEMTDAVPAPGGSVLGWLQQSQQQLLQQSLAQERAEVQLRRLSQFYAALSACNQAIVRCTSEQDMLEQVCRAVVDQGGLKMA